MGREVEKWITIGGRRIPIFKRDGTKKIKGIAKPKGNPEYIGYGKYEGKLVKYKYDDYPSKKAFEKDLRANEVSKITILDKRDKYISDHTNYRKYESTI